MALSLQQWQTKGTKTTAIWQTLMQMGSSLWTAWTNPPVAWANPPTAWANPLTNQILQQSAWLLDSSRIALGRRLAVGGFAEVFLGRMEGALVAVKRLFIYDDDSVRRFSHEVDVLSRLRHPNLIQFMGYTLLPEPTIVSEFMSRGSLFHILRRRKGQPLKQP
eukprot:gene2602-30999_t